MSGLRIGADAVRRQLTGAVERIVQVSRGAGGGRFATAYAAVAEDGTIETLWERGAGSAG